MIRRALIPLLVAVSLVAGSGRLFADASHTKGPEPLEISFGQEVKLSDYLVPGKITVFDFYSHYCPPCMAIAPRVKALHETRSDLAVVEVNVNRPGIVGIDWQSPVARQYGLESIPHFKVFGPDGKLMAEGDDAYEMVVGWIK
jgi:thiol-disulfide isomerase/thioredoxin